MKQSASTANFGPVRTVPLGHIALVLRLFGATLSAAAVRRVVGQVGSQGHILMATGLPPAVRPDLAQLVHRPFNCEQLGSDHGSFARRMLTIMGADREEGTVAHRL